VGLRIREKASMSRIPAAVQQREAEYLSCQGTGEKSYTRNRENDLARSSDRSEGNHVRGTRSRVQQNREHGLGGEGGVLYEGVLLNPGEKVITSGGNKKNLEV